MLGACQIDIVDVMEGILVGMTDTSTDLSQCASDPGDILNDLSSAVSYIQQGLANGDLDSLVSAFNEISDAVSEMNQVVDACQGVIDSYETIEQEFTNVASMLSNPYELAFEETIRVIWNFNGIANDITSLMHSIQGDFSDTDGGYQFGEDLGYLFYLITDGQMPSWLSFPNVERIDIPQI